MDTVIEVLRLCVVAAVLIGLAAWRPEAPVKVKAAVGPCHYVPDTDFASCVLDRLFPPGIDILGPVKVPEVMISLTISQP
jgi:hypothetical protein